MKTKIPSLSYNAMFKAVFQSNTDILKRLIQAIFDYYKIDINVFDKELIIKNNELDINNYQDKMLICDYIIKIDEYHELNIEINRSKYPGLSERNLTYSFKIYSDHYKAGDTYVKFSNYTFLQVNFNNFNNPNNKCINCYYLIDAEDLKNRLSNNYSILNVDIAKCFDLVYNKINLEEISDLTVFGAIVYCNYLEDIASILESGLIKMDTNEKDKFLNDVKTAANDKNVEYALRLEKTWEERAKSIEAMIAEEARLKGEQTLEEYRKQGEKALEDAKLKAELITEEYRKQGEKTIKEYRKQGEKALEDAKKEAELISKTAAKEAELISKTAKKEAEQILKAAKEQARQILNKNN